MVKTSYRASCFNAVKDKMSFYVDKGIFSISPIESENGKKEYVSKIVLQKVKQQPIKMHDFNDAIIFLHFKLH